MLSGGHAPPGALAGKLLGEIVGILDECGCAILRVGWSLLVADTLIEVPQADPGIEHDVGMLGPQMPGIHQLRRAADEHVVIQLGGHILLPA
jgi:hypothetical protein